MSAPVLASQGAGQLGRCRAWGVAGTLCVALGGLGAGAGPAAGPLARPDLPVDLFNAGVTVAYFGLVLLVVAWWRLGRLVRQRPLTVEEMLATLLMWAAPLLIAPPVFSRDVYSYLAQGAMVGAGLDVYTSGPADLGGPFSAEVPAIWQHTPTPYGPAFLLLATAAAAVVGGHVTVGVLVLRLAALAGVALLAVSLPPLARRCGVPPAAALWLAALNPLVLLHLVGGAHNDALMVGLLAAGLAAAFAGRPVLGAVAVTLAALVKVPVAVGLAGVALIWAARATGRWRRVRAFGGTGLVALGTAVFVTWVAGTGFGWVGALRTPVTADSWSLTSALGRGTEAWLAALDASLGTAPVTVWRLAGMCAAVAAALFVWHRRRTVGPVRGVGLVLGGVVVFGPAVRPWYLLWAVVPLAAAAPHGRAGRVAAAACAVLALVVLPDGFAPTAHTLGFAVIGGFLAVALLVMAAFATQPDDDLATGLAR
ncbi:polyprenol phosphomannose-dependent alpha 1,6 mannosyltransferase MptB [Asanoa sp. WMMD1127]|uniref:polyprenol phosphomannose-dependent alpha 1,6 mannosyltransferase MptB n=1 Tax=Asanoa sp. WMMD1127 TaxID=3016107 RepID=UPI0024163EBA|nr:polyprenol phosphomannose-dependent alpha 1,6 mannosyltransferase MptB [Asanoa sp. WMMD1127]MDG4824453.1 polyprenol phosphomannose-dependent alpha 1,6 mannosyltransferase MptB [Asanoa sp. WMMD1127]